MIIKRKLAEPSKGRRASGALIGAGGASIDPKGGAVRTDELEVKAETLVGNRGRGDAGGEGVCLIKQSIPRITGLRIRDLPDEDVDELIGEASRGGRGVFREESAEPIRREAVGEERRRVRLN